MSAFPHIPSEGVKTVVSIIQEVAKVPNLLGDMKVIKQTNIPSNSIVKKKCKAHIEFETKDKAVIFQPLIDPQIDETRESPRYARLFRGATVVLYP